MYRLESYARKVHTVIIKDGVWYVGTPSRELMEVLSGHDGEAIQRLLASDPNIVAAERNMSYRVLMQRLWDAYSLYSSDWIELIDQYFLEMQELDEMLCDPHVNVEARTAALGLISGRAMTLAGLFRYEDKVSRYVKSQAEELRKERADILRASAAVQEKLTRMGGRVRRS